MFLLTLMMTYTSSGFAKDFEHQSLRASEFFDKFYEVAEMGRGVILDVRTAHEYEGGHAPESLNIDYYKSDFRSQLNMLDKNEYYFVYCRSGNRSSRAMKIMQELGFKYVYELKGGWSRHSRDILKMEHRSSHRSQGHH